MELRKQNNAALTGALVGQPQGKETTYTAKPLRTFPMTMGAGAFVPASNAFGFRLLSALTTGPSAAKAGNVFLSPLSLSLALTMTMDGAGGATRQQMQKALGYRPGDAPGAIDADAQAFLAQYQSGRISPDVAADIASALWPNAALPPDRGHLDPGFAARVARTFGAAAQAVNFADASGARQVNAWTREHTRGKITSILPEKPMPDMALALTNAVYFKAKWNHHFYPESTVPGAFMLGSGQKKTLPMMSQTAMFAYLKGDGFEALQLPYDDGRFSLHLLLPNRGTALSAFAARHLSSAAQWNGYLARFKPTKVALQLPRFKLAYDAGELVPHLKSLGMASAFEAAHADFRPMGFQKAYVSSVRHKTTLVVDESGSEATAVTAVSMMVGAAFHRPEPIIPFVVDRPFACAIRDNATGALLFLGLIADPETV